MFDRGLFKSNAKTMLKRYYWLAFLALLIVNGITMVVSMFSSGYNLVELYGGMFEGFRYLMNGQPELSGEIFSNLTTEARLPQEVVEISNIINTAFSALVSPLLAVCTARFFLHSRENKANLKQLLNPFKKNFGNNLGTMLLQNLFLWLWVIIPMMIALLAIFLPMLLMLDSSVSIEDSSDVGWVIVLVIIMFYGVVLLSCIGAMVKTYEYSMLPWILAENTKITYKRAFQLTKAMTKGYKWRLFVLNLSFMGWNFLAMFVPFGIYFLLPYVQATNAEAYTFLKARALDSGLATVEDFPGLKERPASAEMHTETALPAPESESAIPAAETSDALAEPDAGEIALVETAVENEGTADDKDSSGDTDKITADSESAPAANEE